MVALHVQSTSDRHIVLYLLLLICLCSRCAALQPQPYKVPWTAKINGQLWIFQTAPLPSRPQPTPSQRFSSSWAFKGGPGIMIVARYEDAPLLNNKTSYSELVYIPGRYQPCASSPEAYYTVAQMLVDDAHARAAGRAVWGYPKEMARFTWTSAGASTLLRVHRLGQLIFSANFTDSSSSSSSSSQPYLPAWLVLADQRTIQVPIPRKASDPRALVRSRVEYSFSAGLPSRAAVSGLLAEPEALTGNSSLAVVALASSEVVRFPLGATGSLPAPEPFKCA